MSPSDPGDINGLPVIERKVGATTYIVSAEYSKNAKETAIEKMRRIILKNHKKVS